MLPPKDTGGVPKKNQGFLFWGQKPSTKIAYFSIFIGETAGFFGIPKGSFRLDVPRLGGRASKRLNDRVRRRKWCLVDLGSVEVGANSMGGHDGPWLVKDSPPLTQLGYLSSMGLGDYWRFIGKLHP